MIVHNSEISLKTYGDPELDMKCNSVTLEDLTNPEFLNAVDKMREIMTAKNGIGIAANQVGVLKRVFLIRTQKEGVVVFVNPEIVDREGAIYFTEGCLSAPGVSVGISRAEQVTVRAQSLKGEEFTVALVGVEAVCAQHELDHLDGVFFLDRTNRQQRKQALKLLSKV